MKVNVNSWHFKIFSWARLSRYSWGDVGQWRRFKESGKSGAAFIAASDGYSYSTALPNNFCQYLRSVLLYPTLQIITGGIAWAGIIYALSWIFINDPITAIVVFGGVVALIALLLAVAFMVFGAAAAIQKGQERFNKLSNDSSSFVGAIVRKHRENVCTLMDYKESETDETK